MGAVTRSECFCGASCSAYAHERSVIWVAIVHFSTVDHVYIKGDACIVSGCTAVRSACDGVDSVGVASVVCEVEHG